MSVDIIPSTPQSNQLAEYQQPQGAIAEIASRRSMAEVQAMAYMAKQFPRDQRRALDRILIACQRPGLAKSGRYAYPKGGKSINGPSIRLAEVLAREWGNLQYGYIELDRTDTTITAQAYCWDMETNTRSERTITISTKMVYGSKNNSKQEYERSLSEMVANQMQRRVRMCILAIIPSDITESAYNECLKTERASLNWVGREGENKRRDDITRMVLAFAEFGISKKQIENRFQRNIDSIEPAQYLNLREIYTSLKDGMSSVETWFDKEEEPAPQIESSVKSATEKATARLKEKAEKARKSEPVAQPVPKSSISPEKRAEIEKWIQDGCETKEDYDIAVNSLVNNGMVEPVQVQEAWEIVIQVAAKNGIKM